MDKIQKHNLNNIKRSFERKTGTCLTQQPMSTRKNPLKPALVAAATSVFCLLLVAFTYPLFSPLEGDALSLHSVYEGDGVVTITVENRSHKKLEFEPQVRLYRWITGEEVPVLSDDILFEGTSISPRSTEIMTIDLSGAYNIEDLEDSKETEWYYLLLTNYNFVFGQEWKCSVFFGQETEKMESPNEPFFSLDPVVLSNIEEELRFYFEDDYVGIFAGNPMNYEYLQTVNEYLLRCGKRIVPSVNPGLMVKPIPDGIILDKTYPEEKQYTLAGQNQSIHDAFGKLVGATETENIQILQAWAPTEKGAEDGAWAVPVMFFATYEISAIESSEDCAFIHGQIVSFGELEPYKVYEEKKCIYLGHACSYVAGCGRHSCADLVPAWLCAGQGPSQYHLGATVHQTQLSAGNSWYLAGYPQHPLHYFNHAAVCAAAGCGRSDLSDRICH